MLTHAMYLKFCEIIINLIDSDRDLYREVYELNLCAISIADTKQEFDELREARGRYYEKRDKREELIDELIKFRDDLRKQESYFQE